MADMQRTTESMSPSGNVLNFPTEHLYRETVVGRMPVTLDRQQIMGKVSWSHEHLARSLLTGVEGEERALYGALRDLEWKIGNPEFPTGAWNDPRELSMIAVWAEPILDYVMVRSPSFEVRLQAAFLIGRFGAHAAGSAGILKWLARDRREDERLRDQAIASAGSVLGNRSAPFLFDILAGWRHEPAGLIGRAAYAMVRSVSNDVLKEFGEALIITSSAFLDAHRGDRQDWEKDQLLTLMERVATVEPILGGWVRQLFAQIIDDESENRLNREFAMTRLVNLTGVQALPLLEHYSFDETMGQHASLTLYSLINNRNWLTRSALRFWYDAAYQRGELQSRAAM
jgi:hypothetical protein